MFAALTAKTDLHRTTGFTYLITRGLSILTVIRVMSVMTLKRFDWRRRE